MGLFDMLLGKNKEVSEHNREICKQMIKFLRGEGAGKFIDLGDQITRLRKMGADFEMIGAIVCNLLTPKDGSPAPLVGKLTLNPHYR